MDGWMDHTHSLNHSVHRRRQGRAGLVVWCGVAAFRLTCGMAGVRMCCAVDQAITEHNYTEQDITNQVSLHLLVTRPVALPPGPAHAALWPSFSPLLAGGP
jgi:hypothetical protein